MGTGGNRLRGGRIQRHLQPIRKDALGSGRTSPPIRAAFCVRMVLSKAQRSRIRPASLAAVSPGRRWRHRGAGLCSRWWRGTACAEAAGAQSRGYARQRPPRHRRRRRVRRCGPRPRRAARRIGCTTADGFGRGPSERQRPEGRDGETPPSHAGRNGPVGWVEVGSFPPKPGLEWGSRAAPELEDNSGPSRKPRHLLQRRLHSDPFLLAANSEAPVLNSLLPVAKRTLRFRSFSRRFPLGVLRFHRSTVEDESRNQPVR
jgi:hypothetical protein